MKKKMASFCIAFILMMQMFMGQNWVKAATEDVEINATNFPDENFRNWVQTNADMDQNGSLSIDERTTIKGISISNQSITSLKGVEWFTEVTSLYCQGNSISTLDLSNIRDLRRLKCYNNQLTELTLPQITYAYAEVDCSNNQLTALNIADNTSIWKLYCQENQLTELDLSKCIGLEGLKCYNNNLTSLDVSKFDKLGALYCNGNQISSISLSSSHLAEAYHSGELTDNGEYNTYNMSYLLDPEGNRITIDEYIGHEKEVGYSSSSWTLQIDKTTAVSLINPTYVVEYHANRGTGAPASQIKEEDVALTLSSIKPSKEYRILYHPNGGSISTDTKNVSCIFKNWNTSMDGSGTSYPSGGSYTDNAYVKLFAQWQDPVAGELAIPTRSGYKFVGWYTSATGGTEITASTTISENCGLYAHWEESSNTYTVSYNANGGTGAPASQTKDENVDLILSSTKPTKKFVISYNANGGSVSPSSKNVNCVFKNWNTSQNGSGTSYSSGGSYTANADVTLYAQWQNPTVGELATPTRSGYTFAGWYTSATGGQKITDTSTITGNCTIYARWGDPYNLGDETYSFENYGDSHSPGGHCFGMSITSAGYYNNLLNISKIGGNANSSLYSFSATQTVKKPICYYQDIQGSYSRNAIVAGGSTYKTGISDISSDWLAVVNYVKNHEYDDTGLLQIGFRKDSEGGHAINFLRYENVNGQDRIYAYDNNFPTQETYFYKDSNGHVRQTPVQTFSGAIDCIALRNVNIYFSSVRSFDSTHVLYMDKDVATVQGYSYSYMESGPSGADFVMYEIPADVTQVTVIPSKDYADFIYMDTEYSFGAISDDTYGVFILSTLDETSGGSNASLQIYHSAGWHKINGKWFYYEADGNPIVGWKKIGSAWYYMNNNGVMQTGWQNISNKWYYFNSSGAMQSGWQTINNKKYYFNSSGAMQTGWQKIDSKWYYFESGGYMVTGWKQLSSKWYYFGTDGIMQTSWKTISGKTYYFKSSGVMAANEWCNGWWLNKDGTWTYKYKGSWHQNSKGWWFGDESGWYAKNTTITINNIQYTFDANGYMK